MSGRGFIIIALLASTGLAAPAAADTLRDALVSAYETNPNLTAAREGQRATNEGVPLAKANGRPRMTVQPTYIENVLQDGGASVVLSETLGSQAAAALLGEAGDTVFDIACGTGVLPPHLIDAGWMRVVGADPSASMLDRAAERTPEVGRQRPDVGP